MSETACENCAALEQRVEDMNTALRMVSAGVASAVETDEKRRQAFAEEQRRQEAALDRIEVALRPQKSKQR